ncbi:MAG: hypothetical protein GY694_20550 [Gammaproteobacteria bacterium]|nr:hypothetical protein [Gammaproteobacteria bacterium]
MSKKTKYLLLLFIFTVLLPSLTLTIVSIPSVQKYVFENQLSPWISDAQVDSLHITPFSIQIKNLKFKYDAINIQLDSLDSKISPFSLLSQRIKIDKFVLSQVNINDATEASESKDSSTLLFKGLFPYFDSGFIYDLGLIDVHASYTSPATGPVNLSLSGDTINENTSNPLKLNIDANALQASPDIAGISLNSSIILKQQAESPINAHQSLFDLTLTDTNDKEQLISIQLSMKQLPKPDKWASFPFDKRQTHYLKKRLHPEQIELNLVHTNEKNKILSEVHYSGAYDGNEGTLSGAIKILTDKELTSQFKSLFLPKVESLISGTFKYNTRSLEGNINLIDEFQIEEYLPVNESEEISSLPEQINVSNHIIARIDNKEFILQSFLLDMNSDGQDYISIKSHQTLTFDLNKPAKFLEQQNSKLFQVTISQLPLTWFDDFVPDYDILKGQIDTDINLAIENNTLKLTTNRPVHLQDISLQETQPNLTDNTSTQPDEEVSPKVPLSILLNQNLKADILIEINNDNLNASIKQLKLFQNKEENKVIDQASSSLSLNMKDPINFIEGKTKNNSIPPVAITTNGKIDINTLRKIPVLSRKLDELTLNSSENLSDSLPEILSLDYQFDIKGASTIWAINKSNITIKSSAKSDKNNQLMVLTAPQQIKFKQSKEHLTLLTKGKLISTKINHFDFKWLSPLMKEHATPYTVSGELAQLDLTLSSIEQKKQTSDTEVTNQNAPVVIDQERFNLNINKLNFSQLKAHDSTKTLFEDININSKVKAHYSPETISLNYPSLSIKKKNKLLLANSGGIRITNPGDDKSQQVTINGKLNSYLNHLMTMNIISYYTDSKATLTKDSLLDAEYNLTLKNNKIVINPSNLKVSHPQNNGYLHLITQKPIHVSTKDKQHNFSQNGHLSFELVNFNLDPYEAMLTELPIKFDQANGHFDLIQHNNRQEIILKKPFKFQNIHFKDNEERLLNPFNVILDFSAHQKKNISKGEIKQLSVEFINADLKGQTKKKALDLSTTFKLNLDNKIILSEVDGHLNLAMTQWLSQPAAIPDNTLKQGSLDVNFSLDKQHNIKHKWLINNLVDNNDKQLVESISIDGTGQLDSLSEFKLSMPINMKSVSGESNLLLESQVGLKNGKKKIHMNIDGKVIYLNDLLKLLAAINPKSELSQLEAEKEKQAETDQAKIDVQNSESAKLQSSKSLPPKEKSLNKVPAVEPFWKSGIDIAALLKIDTLYYTDYMSYQDIAGELDLTKEKLHAKNFNMKFHESPMLLNAVFDFKAGDEQPYTIDFNTSLTQFGVGDFLKELNPEHVPRAEGVFDVDVNIYGGLSNLSQFRNELLFDILIEGKNGVYHLIPSDDVMLRSSGEAMAIVGEVVSVLPTSGFGLGIVNRVIRFTKDIDYDFIKMHLVRKNDLNTSIETFQIVSPELHLLANGGLTFVEDTRLFDQPLEMTARLDLAGEGAAIFYGLGLLEDEQDEYGFWKGPIINFKGTLNHQEDNFDEIISKAKSGTVVGGVTNPFSGIIGNFKYRWFGDAPEYSELNKGGEVEKSNLPPQTSKDEIKEKERSPVKNNNPSSTFFDETF